MTGLVAGWTLQIEEASTRALVVPDVGRRAVLCPVPELAANRLMSGSPAWPIKPPARIASARVVPWCGGHYRRSDRWFWRTRADSPVDTSLASNRLSRNRLGPNPPHLQDYVCRSLVSAEGQEVFRPVDGQRQQLASNLLFFDSPGDEREQWHVIEAI